MYKAKDGKEFAHAGMGKSYDGALSGGKGGLKPDKPAVEGQHGEQDPHEVVAEHGPAHTTQIAKKDESHSVHSHHEDGHKHSSHGHNIESAHKHSMIMHGHDEQNPQHDDTSELHDTPSESPNAETSNLGM